MSSWFDQAECRNVKDISIFFPDAESVQLGSHVWSKARAFCSRCPVSRECLEFQMLFEEKTGRRDGMWGGLSPKERDQLARERMRPRL